MIKTQATCHDCRHYAAVGYGSKECPTCGTCICHGETLEEIKARFEDNLVKGKFVKSTNPLWDYQCVGNKEVEV